MNKDVKIFIIDKDETSTSVITAYLRETEIEMDINSFTDLESAEKEISATALNLFVVDISEDYENISDKIDKIDDKYQNCKFIITSYNLKTDMIVKFLRKSKKEFFEKPILKNDFIVKIKEIIHRLTSEQDFSGHGKVITVYSNKGGLGKTAIAVNLAMELSQSDKTKKVLLLDINNYLGDVTTFLNMTPTYDIQYIIDKMNTVLPSQLSEIIAKYSGNLYVLADSPYREYRNDIPSETLISLFNLLRKEFEYIIVDCSSAISNKNNTLFELSDRILLITVANLPTINNCKRCLEFFSKLKMSEKLLMVLNRYSQSDEVNITDIQDYLSLNFAATVPNDWNTVAGAINQGKTVREFNGESPVSYSFRNLSRIVKDYL